MVIENAFEFGVEFTFGVMVAGAMVAACAVIIVVLFSLITR